LAYKTATTSAQKIGQATITAGVNAVLGGLTGAAYNKAHDGIFGDSESTPNNTQAPVVTKTNSKNIEINSTKHPSKSAHNQQVGQAGAYKNKEKANERAEALNSQGINARVELENTSQGSLWTIIISPEDVPEARKLFPDAPAILRSSTIRR